MMAQSQVMTLQVTELRVKLTEAKAMAVAHRKLKEVVRTWTRAQGDDTWRIRL